VTLAQDRIDLCRLQCIIRQGNSAMILS